MRNFLINARDGNVAMIFALCLIPMLILMGGAVDMSRQRGAETTVQNAVDSALLAVAQQALDKNEAQLTRLGREWLDNQIIDGNIDITSFTITKSGNTLTAEATGSIDTSFLALMGLQTLDVKRRASVQFGIRNVEIALVLDTTGSMENTASGTQSCSYYGCTGGMSKLAVLKQAATKMMTSLEAASSSTGQISVGVVPFATYVNVGPENANEKWIDSDGKSPVNGDNIVPGIKRLDLYEHLGKEWKGCVQRARMTMM